MAHRSILPRSERAAVLTAAVVVHLSLFALLLAIGSAAPIPLPVGQGSMSLISIAPDVAQGKPPPPALPSKVADPTRVLPQDSFSAELDPTPLGAASGCATFELVAKSLTDEPAVAAAVLTTPLESRSIAGAVVIWNAGWSTNAGSGDSLGPAREVIEQSLRLVPDNCLDEPVAGPRLVPIPEGDRTMFLAIGSGNWTWRQLLTETDPALSAVTQQNPSIRSLWDWLTIRPTKP